MSPRLRTDYLERVRPRLMQELGYTNPLQVPRLAKIVVNVGIGEATQNDAIVESAVRDVSAITGQRPVVTRARRSIANFRLREGQRVGVMATLRGDRMYEFLDRLVSVVVPRIRDFRGVSAQAFDGRGNYSLGLADQTVFPEIRFDRIDQVRGLQVVLVTTARSDTEARRLLELLRMPFARAEAA